MKTVKQVSKFSGVSIKTLHYYDEIGILKPEKLTESGYRLYGEKELQRLQKILLYKELNFSLKDIKHILENEQNIDEIIDDQIALLTMKRDYFDNLIAFANKLRKDKGYMDFTMFDKSKMNDFEKRAKEKWGTSKPYAQYEENIKDKNSAEINFLYSGLMDIFKKFSFVIDKKYDDSEVVDLVKMLQNYITENFYDCTLPILKSLGEMYRSDEFRVNIDFYAGEGVADFVANAIEHYEG